DWTRDLQTAVALDTSHLSVYGLTVESGTPLGRWTARGRVHEPTEDRWAGEFLQADGVLTEAGFTHYEVSNYAKPGARARHNGAYWRRDAYLGIGPSAHGFDGRVRRWNEPAYARWLSQVASGTDPLAGSEALTDEQRQAECVYLGL